MKNISIGSVHQAKNGVELVVTNIFVQVQEIRNFRSGKEQYITKTMVAYDWTDFEKEASGEEQNEISSFCRLLEE